MVLTNQKVQAAAVTASDTVTGGSSCSLPAGAPRCSLSASP